MNNVKASAQYMLRLNLGLGLAGWYCFGL
ncbi:hypothetical protein F383_26371 [Gossypium arboreum]|uniref:Uncharacterized protein n=1 Tax=Gossypium arboreum TaxID=29729 RepID=A0A0B0P1N5_GOSAR|nr:hypothetical protein F383_07897 [Gossypium arboreum]KHG20693.1 hypothetical protein F383_26371 [Gossypium arboreum]